MAQEKSNRLAPLIVHPLPPAPSFTGRQDELAKLRGFWDEGPGVLSLIGLGGAGKTALAEKFVEWVQANDPPEGLLIWSFYDDPDANTFLKTAHRYFTGGREAHASGAGWFHLLNEEMSKGGRYLIVLDGLERVQRQQTDASGMYGELEDPLLRGFLFRLAAGAGQTKAVITSRFPVSSIERWLDRGYRIIDVDQLTGDSARAVLRAQGVRGSDEELDYLVREYGGHALTLDLLACAISKFFGGDPSKAPPLDVEEDQRHEQAARLSCLLQVFERELSSRQVEILSRLCVFRFGVDLDALYSIFVGEASAAVAGALKGASKEEVAADLQALVSLHLAGIDTNGRYTVHPAIRDHFYRLFRDPTAMHEAVRGHLVPLSHRPGIGLPEDAEALDLLEELVYHAIQAGSVREAAEIYMGRLGGNDHLNTHLGEYNRTYRILRAFPECPDPTGMYHCLRAFGRYDEALQWRPNNRYILLLSGLLTPLADDTNDATRNSAKFLQGQDTILPERTPDWPLPASMLQLLRNDVIEAERLATIELRNSIYMDDKSRNEIVMAEVERARGSTTHAEARLERVSQWVLNSGSQEHLCLMHWVRSRVSRDVGVAYRSGDSLDEGILTARECKFNLLLVELLLDKAKCCMESGDLPTTEGCAREALEFARDPKMRYQRGIKTATQVLGDVLQIQGKHTEAEAVRAGHP
jgi:hypothetical protein